MAAVHHFSSLLCALLQRDDQRLNLRCGLLSTLGRATYFISDHGEAATGLTSPRGFDGGVERQQVSFFGVARDLLDGGNHFAHGRRHLVSLDFLAVDAGVVGHCSGKSAIVVQAPGGRRN
ncbi:hypothetical protein D3C80_608630 [compost metagenome]